MNTWKKALMKKETEDKIEAAGRSIGKAEESDKEPGLPILPP